MSGRLHEHTMAALAVAFLAAYAAPILWPALPAWAAAVCHGGNLTIWGLFWLDYLVRLARAEHRWRFIRGNLLELATLALPVLRALRFLRVVTAVARLAEQGEGWTRRKIGLYLAGVVGLLALVSSLAILDAERGQPDATISTYPDALWWAIVTMTTVGYGDYSPVTGEGRLVATVLMIAGIGLLGSATGTITSWVLDRVSRAEQAEVDVAAVLAEVRALRLDLERGQGRLRQRQSPEAVPGHGGESGRASRSS